MATKPPTRTYQALITRLAGQFTLQCDDGPFSSPPFFRRLLGSSRHVSLPRGGLLHGYPQSSSIFFDGIVPHPNHPASLGYPKMTWKSPINIAKNLHLYEAMNSWLMYPQNPGVRNTRNGQIMAENHPES